MTEYYKFEHKKVDGKIRLVRIWFSGWFPTCPIKGTDFKAKDWSKEYYGELL